ncbi:MAG TPA: hypothetical protein VEW46_16660 [Pyrinomonadaceae bacterium]|nr:hypothetical protein [Pyrinomonadaceae bacterium]
MLEATGLKLDRTLSPAEICKSQMNPGIYLEKIWSDDDALEIQIHSSDGASVFCSHVYAGHQSLTNLITELSVFKDHVYGGIYDIQLGSFGPEYASGAFHARLHFQTLSKIHITVKAQSEFKEFGMKHVASEATLYFVSEPILLDNFIAELKALSTGMRNDAKLEAA